MPGVAFCVEDVEEDAAGNGRLHIGFEALYFDSPFPPLDLFGLVHFSKETPEFSFPVLELPAHAVEMRIRVGCNLTHMS